MWQLREDWRQASQTKREQVIEMNTRLIISHSDENNWKQQKSMRCDLLQCLGVRVQESANEDCSPCFFHSCQPALELGPNLAMSTGRPSSSKRRFNRCQDKLLRYLTISDTSACSSYRKRVITTQRITTWTGSSRFSTSKRPGWAAAILTLPLKQLLLKNTHF